MPKFGWPLRTSCCKISHSPRDKCWVISLTWSTLNNTSKNQWDGEGGEDAHCSFNGHGVLVYKMKDFVHDPTNFLGTTCSLPHRDPDLQLSHSDPQGYLHAVLWAPKHRYFHTTGTWVSPWAHWWVALGAGADGPLHWDSIRWAVCETVFKIVDLKLRSALKYCRQFSEWVSTAPSLGVLSGDRSMESI